MRDRCEIDKDKEIKDVINKSEVAQLGLSPLQDGFKGNCEVDCEVNCEADIYIIGGYDRLINKLRAKFVNMVSDEKGYKGFVGKERERVFILTGYVSHSDIYKIESLGIYGKFVNSKGVNGIIREMFFGELLDKTFRDMCIDGTAVWKIYESKKDGEKCLEIRNVDLLNFYIDPTAKSIQDTEAVIERNVMTVGEISSYSGWKNIDGLQGVNNLPKIDSDRMYSQSYTNQVPMRDVYERWGLASEYWITGDKKDKNNLVNTHIVVSGLDKGQSPRVHLIEKYEGYKPYEEFWYRRVANRWYGKGPAEALSQLQEQINLIVNIRINRAILSQLGLFKLRKGSGITPQILRKLGSNGAIPVQDMNDIAQMPIADVPVSSYKDEEVINSWSQRVTNSFEVSTGDNLPATTPATNAMLSDRAPLS